MVEYPTEQEVQAQIQREEEFYKAGAQRALREFNEAVKQNRTADIPIGKRVIMQVHNDLKTAIEEYVQHNTKGRLDAGYRMIARVDPEVLAIITLRVLLNCAFADAATRRVQSVMNLIGMLVETEVLATHLKEVKPRYMDKVQDQIKEECSRSTRQIRRKYNVFAKDVGVDFESLSQVEKCSVGKALFKLVAPFGLFEIDEEYNSKYPNGCPVITPSEVLRNHYADMQNHLKAHVHFPVMFCKPRDWTSQFNGGYYIPELQAQAPMMKIRYLPKELRRWVYKSLSEQASEPARCAMNKSQGVPYLVNQKVLQIARKALSDPNGVLGLPPHGSKPKPEFPFDDGWKKDEATEAQLNRFSTWKADMKAWYTYENTRVGRKLGIAQKLHDMSIIPEGQKWYCPTFIDWRGRMYFKSTLNPQSADVIKGCIDFYHKKRLGTEGLYWLWFHIANCAGYDKASPDLRVKWAKEHWDEIQQFLNNPFTVEPPEVDTAFTLLQAGYAMQEALSLSNPEDYMCSVPVAIDATCSGLQHYSAMLRDEVGGYYTNLIDDHTEDCKHDIYTAVANTAIKNLDKFTDDPVILDFWRQHGIPRSMAKHPVMTYVYSATLRTCIEYVYEGMQDIQMPDGYSAIMVCTPVGKAIRNAVELTVPASTDAMKYLRKLVQSTNEPLMWVTPVGVPVVNYADTLESKNIRVYSMGISSIRMAAHSGKYNRKKAINGISPNFIHSLDSTHLMRVINAFNGEILPIHDSFATHPCDVSELRDTLLRELYELYEGTRVLELFRNLPESAKEIQQPAHGHLCLTDITKSRFAFC